MNAKSHELWIDIPGCEGDYQASSLGRIMSVSRTIIDKAGRPRKLPGRVITGDCNIERGGYVRVRICKDGKTSRHYVHRLVLEAFVGPCPEGMEVCHNNGDPTDNRLTNLRYDTHSENMYDKRGHGTDHEVNKTHCPRGHLLVVPNLIPGHLKMGRRACLACDRARAYVKKYEIEHLMESLSDSRYSEIMATR